MNLIKFTSKYFIKTQKILKNENNYKKSTIRFFCFQDNVCLSGIDYLKDLIKNEIKKGKLNDVDIYSRNDGDIINSNDTVLIIVGDYKIFAYLENIIDGVLSRMCSISTNCFNYIKMSQGKKIIFMADRSDFFLNQPLDGLAAYIGGMRDFVTLAQISYLKNKKDVKYVGTMPHSLIQQFNGDIVKTLSGYKKTFPRNKLIALIDYHNNCLEEIEKISKTNYKNKIEAVRIDTSKSLIDKSLLKFKENKEYYGVNHHLVKLIRKKLDSLGMKKVKIIATSGIDIDKISKFNKLKTPIDIYGIGSALIRIHVHFTGDLIKNGNTYSSKFGRNKNIEKEMQYLKKW